MFILFVNRLKSMARFGVFTGISLLVQVLGMLTNIVIAGKVSVSDFGTYTLILTVVGLISTFAFSWSSSTVSFYGSREIVKNGNMRKTIQSRNIILLVSFIITGIVFFLLSSQVDKYIGYECSILVFIWVFVKAINEYVTYYFIAREKKIISSTVSLIGRTANIILLITLDYNLLQLIWISIACELLTLVTIRFIDKEDIRNTQFDYNYFKELLNFSAWQFSGTLSIYIINSAAILIINHYLGEKDVGLFNAAFKLFSGIFILANIITSYYVATISRHFHNEDRIAIKKFYYNIRISLFIAVLIGHILLFLLSNYIFDILYSNKYDMSSTIFNILLLASLCRYWTVFQMIYFNINKMYKFQQLLNVGNAILIVSLCIILIPRIGIVGGALATTISSLIIAIISSIVCEPKIYTYVKSNYGGNQ